MATGNAVLQAGFKPVFVDVERSTLNIDPTQIERAVTDKLGDYACASYG